MELFDGLTLTPAVTVAPVAYRSPEQARSEELEPRDAAQSRLRKITMVL